MCPECGAPIQMRHRVYLNLNEIRDALAQLLQFFRLVEESARQYRDLIEFIERIPRHE